MAGFNTPFRQLKKTLKPYKEVLPPAKPAVSEIAPIQKERSENDKDLFQREMRDVTPLKHDPRVNNPPPAVVRRAPGESESEAIAELYDLVTGRSDFDITDTDEYVEGCIAGTDTRLVRKLRQGEFSRQAALDLHGMKADEAYPEIEQFLAHAARAGIRCVLVVHGRGNNSPGHFPVLKDRLKQWLTRGRLAKMVLAFSSARPHDGGLGAMYILLRRKRGQKKPILILEGAKGE
jgi:DNA-nicking Smr family endonuclease